MQAKDSMIEDTQALIRKDLLNSDQVVNKAPDLESRYNAALEKFNESKLEISNIGREQKALELVDGVDILNSHLAIVKSYKIDYIANTCECKDFEFRQQPRGLYCKHIQAVKLVVEAS